MLENMAGMVGTAMYEERLARSAKNMRLAEATQGQRTADGGYRAAVVRS